MTYRIDFINEIIKLFIKLSSIFILVQLLFAKTNQVEGFTKADFYLLFGMYSICFPLFYSLFGSMGEISWGIKDGYLDKRMAKPMNILFSYICSTQIIYTAADVLTYSGVIIYAYKQGATLPILEALLSVIFGILLLFSLYLFVQTLNFYSLFPNNASNLADAFFDFGRVPANFYPNTIRILFAFVLPLLATGSIAIYINQTNLPKYLYINIAVVIFALLYFSLKFWNYSLKKYTGASC